MTGVEAQSARSHGGIAWRQNGDVTNLQLKPGCSWAETYARCVSVAPEAFESDRIRNLLHGEWQRVGVPGHHVTPIDLSPISGPPRVERDLATSAVEHARDQHAAWSKVGLAERRERVTAAIDTMVLHRDRGSCSPSICARDSVRQAAVHCLPAVCRPATLVARVPRYLLAGRRRLALRPSAGCRASG
jgi:hypothetical protein